MSYGMLGHIGLGKESAWGTAAAAADYFKAKSETLTTNLDRFGVANIIGGLYEPRDEVGVERNEGDIVLAAYPAAAGYVLDGVTGITSVTVVLSGVLFQHEFFMGTADDGTNNPLPPYTLEVFRDVTSSHRFIGAQIARADFSITPNQDLQVTAGIMAKQQTLITKTTPTFPGSPVSPFMFDTCSLSLGGSAVSRIEALSISIDNQIEGIPVLNNTALIQKFRRQGPQLIRVQGTVEFPDVTDFQAFKNQTEQRLLMHFTKASSYALTFDIPSMVFTSLPAQMGGPGRIVADFNAIGRYNSGSGNAFKATLTNINTYGV